jgi:hypothetical protein
MITAAVTVLPFLLSVAVTAPTYPASVLQCSSITGRTKLKDNDVVGDVGKGSGLPSTVLDGDGHVSGPTMKLVVQWHNRRRRCETSRSCHITARHRCQEQHKELLEDMDCLCKSVE